MSEPSEAKGMRSTVTEPKRMRASYCLGGECVRVAEAEGGVVVWSSLHDEARVFFTRAEWGGVPRRRQGRRVRPPGGPAVTAGDGRDAAAERAGLAWLRDNQTSVGLLSGSTWSDPVMRHAATVAVGVHGLRRIAALGCESTSCMADPNATDEDLCRSCLADAWLWRLTGSRVTAGHDDRCEAEHVTEAPGWTSCGCAARAGDDEPRRPHLVDANCEAMGRLLGRLAARQITPIDAVDIMRAWPDEPGLRAGGGVTAGQSPRHALDTAAARLSEAYALLDGINDDQSQALDDLSGTLRWAEPTSAMDQVAHALIGLDPYSIPDDPAPAVDTAGQDAAPEDATTTETTETRTEWQVVYADSDEADPFEDEGSARRWAEMIGDSALIESRTVSTTTRTTDWKADER